MENSLADLQLFLKIFTRVFPMALSLFVSVLCFLFMIHTYQKVRDDLKEGGPVEGFQYLVLGVFAFMGSLGLSLAIYFAVLTARLILTAGGA